MHSQSFAYIAISKDMEFLRTLKSKEDDQSIKLVTNFRTRTCSLMFIHIVQTRESQSLQKNTYWPW